eukprot:1875491-Rhodomonas_salina.1
MELFVVFSFLQRDLLNVRSNQRYVVTAVDDHMRAHLSAIEQAPPPDADEAANGESTASTPSSLCCIPEYAHCNHKQVKLAHTTSSLIIPTASHSGSKL